MIDSIVFAVIFLIDVFGVGYIVYRLKKNDKESPIVKPKYKRNSDDNTPNVSSLPEDIKPCENTILKMADYNFLLIFLKLAPDIMNIIRVATEYINSALFYYDNDQKELGDKKCTILELQLSQLASAIPQLNEALNSAKCSIDSNTKELRLDGEVYNLYRDVKKLVMKTTDEYIANLQKVDLPHIEEYKHLRDSLQLISYILLNFRFSHMIYICELMDKCQREECKYDKRRLTSND